MVRRLGAEFHLAEPHMRVMGGFADCFPEEFGIHEVGTGAGDEEAAVSGEPHAAQVDFAVAAHGGPD